MQREEFEDTGHAGLQTGSDFHGFRKLIWFLADPNQPEYNPIRALTLLQDAITGKWSAVETARQQMDLEPQSYDDLEKLLPQPIVDNGGKSLDDQIRASVEKGLRYLGSSAPGWETEYSHQIARKNLGFEHPIQNDTPEQSAAFAREELRVVHETCLCSAIYDLGAAVDDQHRAYLQGRVDRYRESLALYGRPDAMPAEAAAKTPGFNLN